MDKTRLTVLHYSLSKKKQNLNRQREMRGEYYWSVFRQTMAPYTETNIPLVLVVKLSIKKNPTRFIRAIQSFITELQQFFQRVPPALLYRGETVLLTQTNDRDSAFFVVKHNCCNFICPGHIVWYMTSMSMSPFSNNRL